MKRITRILYDGLLIALAIANSAASEAPTLIFKVQFQGPLNGTPALGKDDSIYINNGFRLRALSSDGKFLWNGRAPLHGREWPVSPVVVDDRSVIMASSQGLLAYSLKDGTELWHVTGEGWVEQTATPAAGFDGTLFFPVEAENNTRFVAAIGTDGAVSWTHSFGILQHRFASPVILQDGKVVINNWYYRILDTEGYRIGEYGSLGWYTEGSPAIDQEGLVYGSSWNNKLFCIDQRGQEKWSRTLDAPIVGGITLARDRNLFFKDTAGNVQSYCQDGTRRWRKPLNGFTSPFDTEYSVPTLLGDGTLLVGSGSVQGGIYCLDQTSGDVLWTFRTQGRVVGSVNVDSKNSLIFGDDNGILYKLAGVSGLGESTWPKYHGDAANSGRPRLLVDVSAGTGGSIHQEPRTGAVEHGTQIALAAIPEAGFVFHQWTGGVVSEKNPFITTAIGNIRIQAVFKREPFLRVGSIDQDPTQGFRLQVVGKAGRRYAIEASSDLQSWTSLATMTNETVQSEYFDNQARSFTTRFYRARPAE
ncbi:MAG: PQQ-like beta-propeller repeat protein [Verrucomicrobia bacterium]|nr:PQQ-like beta-propeller repeat protein [Verrucomicrobiota bacterium]